MTTARNKAFISYSHKDASFLEELLVHLKPLERAGRVSKWSDKEIAAGSKWFETIQAELAAAKVAVMLVSPDFLASDFVHEHELGPLLKQAEAGGVTLLWVPVRASNYKMTGLKQYQAVISAATPLNQLPDRDAAWVAVCEKIEEVLNPPSPGSRANSEAFRGVPSVEVTAQNIAPTGSLGPLSKASDLLAPAPNRIRLIQEVRLTEQLALSLPQVEDLLTQTLEDLPYLLGVNPDFFRKRHLFGFSSPLRGPIENQQGGLYFSAEHEMPNRKQPKYYMELLPNGSFRLSEYIDDPISQAPILNIQYVAIRIALFLISSVRLSRRLPGQPKISKRWILREVEGVMCSVDNWAVIHMFGQAAGVGVVHAPTDLSVIETGWLPQSGDGDGLLQIAPLVRLVIRELFYKFRLQGRDTLGLVHPSADLVQEAVRVVYERFM